MNTVAAFLASVRASFALPAMRAEPLAALREPQSAIHPSSPVVAAVPMIAGFVGRDPWPGPRHKGITDRVAGDADCPTLHSRADRARVAAWPGSRNRAVEAPAPPAHA